MKIQIDDAGRTFECVLHFAGHLGGTLYAASFAGTGTAVWAIAAGIIQGRRTLIIGDDGKIMNVLSPTMGMYKKFESKVGDIYHCLVLHKAAVFNEEKVTNPIIVAQDGDIRKAVGRYLTAKYPLPVEWEDKYRDILNIENVTVIRNPIMTTWADVKIGRISSVKRVSSEEVNDETIKEGVDKAIKSSFLKFTGEGGLFHPSWTMKQYLKANAKILAEQVKKMKPRHDPETDKLHPAIGQMERIPFPAQGHVIQALAKTLEEQNMAIACGDMGTGKSTLSVGLCNVLYKEKKTGMSVLLSAPGITIPKWEKREIAETLPDAKTYVIRSTEDAARYLRMVREGYEPEGLEFVLVGIDRAKLGPDPWCSAVWKRIRGTREYAWHCPDCGEVLLDMRVKAARGEEPYLTWAGLASGKPPKKHKNLNSNGVPKGHPLKWKLPAKTKKCTSCNTPLWRPALKSRGETVNKPRWFVSFILKRLRKHFDLFICDEVHQTKAADSGRGDAFAQMIKSAKKVLCLTGTLVNGLSTSIKEILWRTDPQSLIRDGFTFKSGAIAWAKRYGVLERVTRSKDDDYDVGVVTRRKKNQIQPKELPGIAPQMVANHMLHRAAFLELGSLGLPLVELKEIPVLIKMDTEHEDAYKEFHRELKDACTYAHRVEKVKGAFARFISSTISYADQPYLGAEVVIKKGEEVIEAVHAPSFPEDYYHAKERELVRIVRENLAEGRGCVIYANYTDSFKVHHRLRDVLAAHGIECHVLESSVSPEKRVEWLALKEEEGAKIIICNMRLVEVGLDLLPWPTIIFYQLNYDINTVRQASRRAWRIGQTRECRTYYMVYEGTQQAAQFEQCMVKRAHAMLAEGRLDRSELAAFGRDANGALAVDLADCLAGEEVARKWEELAKRDMDEDLEMVEESRFLEVLAKAKKRLAKETLELCGLPADEIEEAVSEEEETKRPTILELAAFLPKRRRARKPKVPEEYKQMTFEKLFGIG
ncbi:MAG: hypothetical protein A4E53_01504 [Pelotomaculum sp. PtaB.Bin104]|nr:MAG: hypothetical protein A4E53_01504 [Pelotomaculum sp. PtaB.Bin104]